MRQLCAITSCKSGTVADIQFCEQSNIKPARLFQVTKDRLKEWSVGVNQILREKQFVCEKHFKPEDIRRVDAFLMADGTIITVPRKKIDLKKNAVPFLKIGSNHLHEGTNVTIPRKKVNLKKNAVPVLKSGSTSNSKFAGKLITIPRKKVDLKNSASFLKIDSTINSDVNIDRQKISRSCSPVIPLAAKIIDRQEIAISCGSVNPIIQKCSKEYNFDDIVRYLSNNSLGAKIAWCKSDNGLSLSRLSESGKFICIFKINADLTMRAFTSDCKVSIEGTNRVTSDSKLEEVIEIMEKDFCEGTGIDNNRSVKCSGLIPKQHQYKKHMAEQRCPECRAHRRIIKQKKHREESKF